MIIFSRESFSIRRDFLLTDPQIRYEELLHKLRQRHYRLTPQRLALLRLLAASENHPSAAQLYEQLKEQYPTMSFGTVYKTISLLKEMGEILELGFSHDDNRYDANKPQPHPHLICISCHKIMDADLPVAQTMLNEVASISGYQIVNHRLDFYGICPECQRRG
jgi:Fur family peroxide stress response transcriptional regulator